MLGFRRKDLSTGKSRARRLDFPCHGDESSWALLHRPFGDGRIDFRHKADGFPKGGYQLPVVLQIVIGQRSATPVFEPLLAYLIAANLEVPDFGRHAFKVLAGSAALPTPYSPPHLGRGVGWGFPPVKDRPYSVDVHPPLFQPWKSRA